MGEDGRTYEQTALDPDELMVVKGVQNLQRNLAAGLTSVRDNGARNRVGFIIREGIRLGYVPGPRVLACGRPITATGGHFHWCNEQADGEEEIRKAVRGWFTRARTTSRSWPPGAAPPGRSLAGPCTRWLSYGQPPMSPRAFGRLTTAHCRASESMLRAIDAGIDLMEHAEFLDVDGTARFDPQLAEMMRDRRRLRCPTLQASCNYRGVQALEAKRESEGLTGAEEARLADLYERMSARRQFPSDAGCGPDAPHGLRLGHGWWAADLRPRADGPRRDDAGDVLQAATRVSAEAIGLGDQIGTLTPGWLADLIAVEGDPSEDISALGRVRAVFQAGLRVV